MLLGQLSSHTDPNDGATREDSHSFPLDPTLARGNWITSFIPLS